MKIDYSWLDNRIRPYLNGKQSLKKYCDCDRALELCYCIRCELQPDSYLLMRLYELMAQASLSGETDSIRGNSTIFHVRSDEIEIVSIFFGEGFSYTHDEFRDQLTKWRQAWRKYRGL